MKHIIKQGEPESFRVWKNKANDDWKPTYENIDNQERIDLLNSLKEEQGYICCYCEREIKEEDCHIEHFKPKDKNKFPELELEYSNLLCSCQRNLKKGDPRHCGNSKENWFDAGLLISPLNSTCESRFKYTFDGQILPVDENDNSAKTTIKKLDLDIDKLKDLRKWVIEPFLELSEDDLSIFIAGYLKEKADNGGKYNEFYTTIKYLFA